MRTCEICGRGIITGRKYCYRHRNSRDDKAHRPPKNDFEFLFLIILGFMVLGIVFFTWGYVIKPCSFF